MLAARELDPLSSDTSVVSSVFGYKFSFYILAESCFTHSTSLCLPTFNFFFEFVGDFGGLSDNFGN